MASYMTDEIALGYSTFTTDDNLNPDSFIVFQDVDKSHSDMIDRYYVLKNKQYTTDAEKAEMTQLAVNLQEYLPTSDTWNKLCACIRTMQMFMRDGIVVFANEKKAELTNMLKSYKDVGDWTGIKAYSFGNLVRHGGFGFLSVIDNNLNHEPNIYITEDAYWIKFTIKGDKGDPSLNISIKKGTDGSANYDPLTTYNIGDACIYNYRLYYAIVDGVIGFVPTNTTKWACADKVWVDSIEPLNKNMIWWDRNDNTLKIYNINAWIPQTLNGKVATGTLLTNAKINLVDAINELKTRIDNLNLTASNITVVDSGNLYNGTNTEACLAEVMTKTNSTTNTANTALNNASTAQARADSAFQFANDGKINIANAIIGKGISASGSDTFSTLANKIGQIPTGKRFASGIAKSFNISSSPGNTTYMYINISSMISFSPRIIYGYPNEFNSTDNSTFVTIIQDNHLVYFIRDFLSSESGVNYWYGYDDIGTAWSQGYGASKVPISRGNFASADIHWIAYE